MNALFGWRNVISTATLAASASVAGLDPSQLQNDQGSSSTAWRSPGTSGVLIIDSGNPATEWDVFALLRTNLTSSATIAILVGGPATFFTGYGPFMPPVYQSYPMPGGFVPGYGQYVFVPTTKLIGQCARIDILDPTNPDGFLSIPLVYAGPTWSPATNIDFSSSVGRDDQVDEAVSRGGQEYPVFRWARRRWNIGMTGVRQSEVWSQVMDLDAHSRQGGNVLFVPDPLSATLQREAVYGRLKATADLTYPYGAADRRAWKANITERL